MMTFQERDLDIDTPWVMIQNGACETDVHFGPTRKAITMSVKIGNHIEYGALPLGAFLRALGVTLQDCEAALQD